MNNVDLSALFRGMQGQMQSQLSTNREFIHHPGSKGDALERVHCLSLCCKLSA